MINFFKNKIDALMDENRALENKKAKLEDKKNEQNSVIENKMSKLQNKALRKNSFAKAKIDEIDREIAKNKELINTERKFYGEGVVNE